jgi:hypothetical protein
MLSICYQVPRLFQQRPLSLQDIMDTASINLETTHVPYESYNKQRLFPQTALGSVA